MNLRQLEILIEELHCAHRRIRGGQQVWIDWQEGTVVSADRRTRARASERQVAGARRELALTFIDANAGVNEGVVNSRVDHTTVIDAPATAKARLAIAAEVISKTNARTEVIFVAHLVAGLRQQWIRIHWIRIALILVTESEIQSE